MNFVHVEDSFQPAAGYQLNLLSRLQVKQGHQVTIVTSKLDKVPDRVNGFFGKDNVEEKDRIFSELTGVKIIRLPILGYFSGRAIYYSDLFKLVDSLNPDVLFVHGIDVLTGIRFINRASKQKYPMVFDCHMLEMASMNRFRKVFRYFYKTLVTPKIIKYNIPVIRVVDSNYVEKCLGIPLNKTILLSLGTDTDSFRPNLVSRSSFRAEHGIAEDDFVILYAGKLDDHKGGQFFAESIKDKLLTSSGKKIIFVIIGNTVGDYGRNVERTFSESQNRILLFPTQNYFDLGNFYQAADLSVFPKQCSLSFFEVQSCGLPVVLETNEINDERVKNDNGFTFKPDDIDDFRSKMIFCADMDKSEFLKMGENSRKYIIDYFDFIPIAQKYTDVMIDEYNSFHSKTNNKKIS